VSRKPVNSEWSNEMAFLQFTIYYSPFAFTLTPNTWHLTPRLGFHFRDAAIQRIDRKIRLLAIDHQRRHQPDGALTATQHE